jgi:SPP1 family phage portal protein
MGVNDFETATAAKTTTNNPFYYETADVKKILNRKFLDVIRNNKDEVNHDIIEAIIEEHKTERQRTLNAYERYKASAEGVPIFSRTFENEDKVNNKLNNDFIGEIVDTKTGYMFGVPIKYTQAEKDLSADDYVWLFNRMNNVEDLDGETGKMSAITGYGVRLLYVDTEKNERVMNLDPWETIFIANDSIAAPDYAFRYYTTSVFVGGVYKDRVKVEFYNNDFIYFFEKGEDGKFKETQQRQLHLFKKTPVIGFPNNEEYMGDCDKVLSLIDAFDITLSDVSSEITQMRLAYLAFFGDIEIDAAFMKNLKQTGGFKIDGEKADAKFLTKDLSDTIIENHLNRLEDRIARGSKHVNLSDDKFGGNLSGVAIEYKLTPLETKSTYTERKFVTSLRRQYEVLGTSAKVTLDYLNLDFTFKRKLPENIIDEVKTAKEAMGIVSRETQLSLLSFVADPLAEMDKMDKENEGAISLLDTVTGGGVNNGQGQTTSNGGNGETTGTESD